MSFASVIKDGVDRIYREDLQSQKHLLSTVCRVIRERDEIAPLLAAKAFMVPNQDYIKKFFGPESMVLEYDLYAWNGACVWDNFVVFPIENIVGTVVGLVGFDPIAKAKAKDGEKRADLPKYKLSSSSVFSKGRYLYMLSGVFEKAMKDGYIVLTDGIFDMLYLYHDGINAASALGSSLSEEILFLLSFIKTVFVAEDNDDAGRKLYLELKKRHPCVRYIRQNFGKDSDDILKSEYRDLYITNIRRGISNNSNIVTRIKPKLVI